MKRPRIVSENVRFHPQGHTVYILECVNGSYYTGLCQNIEKELKNIKKLKYFKENPEKLPVKVAFKEEHLPFEEAYLKFKYLRSLNRVYRKKIIDTGLWPASKMLEHLILEKMQKHLEEEAII